MELIKLNKTIIDNLQSDDEHNNISGIIQLRNKGKAEYIPYVIRMYQQTTNEEVKKQTFLFLSELKDNKCVPFIMEAIKGEADKKIKKQLIEICWQNGLDYSEYLKLFIDIIIKEDELIGFEAFTVIENLEFLPGKSTIEPLITYIKNNLSGLSTNQQYFLNEAIKMLH